VNTTAAAFLLYAVVVSAGVPQALAAETTEPGAPCNELLPDEPNLRLGQVVGAGTVAFLRDGPDCPGSAAACRTKFAARPGQTVLLGGSRGDYVCAFESHSGSTGWLPQQRIAARPFDPAPPLAAWTGTWRLYDNSIVIKRTGDSVEADGEAYWPGKNIMPANEGEFSGTAKPSGNRLHFGDESQGCTVDLALAGPFLVAADNRGCGGHNVSFTGIYSRRGRESR